MVLDCANGATYQVAPEIFRRLGASVTAVADSPDGRNINADCGSTHVERLAERVLAGGHALGFAFDGDGDRVLAVDGAGEVVDGDELMALAALHLRAAGRLPGDGVVVTVMTNYGFHTAMERRRDRGGERRRSAIATCWRSCCARGWTLGGEQSGHLIEMGFNRTGDGIAGALLTLEALAGRGPERARRDGEAAPAPGERPGARPRGAARARRLSPPLSKPRTRHWLGAGACWCARAGPSRSCG